MLRRRGGGGGGGGVRREREKEIGLRVRPMIDLVRYESAMGKPTPLVVLYRKKA